MPCRSRSASDYWSIAKPPSATPNVSRPALSSPRCTRAHAWKISIGAHHAASTAPSSPDSSAATRSTATRTCSSQGQGEEMIASEPEPSSQPSPPGHHRHRARPSRRERQSPAARGDPDHIPSCLERRGCRHHQMEATMRKFFLIAVVLLSAATAHAGMDVTVADADVRAPEAIQPIVPLSAQHHDASVLAEKRQAMMQQKMTMQKQMMIRKQMAMQREMQLHPIRTRLHFALLKFKRRFASR